MNNTGNQEINPITRLDYPDPDVIRVDNTYYMVSTTMHFMPGCEILRSYDLVNWEHASYVYDVLDSTPGQKIEGEENIYGQGMWAASLRYHKGIFYVCFVANDTGKTYLYSAPSIEGPWKKSYIKVTTFVFVGAILYKACTGLAIRYFVPQSMKMISALFLLAVLLLMLVFDNMDKKKVKKNA